MNIGREIEQLIDKVNKMEIAKALQDTTIEWLKNKIEELETRSTQNENDIDNNKEKITTLLGKYLL